MGTTFVLGIQSNMIISPLRMASCNVARGTTVYDIQEFVIDQCEYGEGSSWKPETTEQIGQDRPGTHRIQ